MDAPATAALLAHEREAIVGSAAHEILRHTGRESRDGEDALVERLDRMLGEVIRSVALRDAGPAVRYAEWLAAERHASGFGIGEVQDALDALEAAAWERLVAKLDAPLHAAALADVATVFGAAKDALGRRWVAAAAHHGLPTLDLDALSSGTDR